MLDRSSGFRYGSPRLALGAVVVCLGSLLALPAIAGASTTVGQTFVPTSGTTCNGSPDWEVLQTARASGPSYAAPSKGVLTSWSFEAGTIATTLTMRAFHPTGTAHQYTIVGDAGALQTIASSSGVHTFPARIPGEAGDLVGIRSP